MLEDNTTLLFPAAQFSLPFNGPGEWKLPVWGDVTLTVKAWAPVAPEPAMIHHVTSLSNLTTSLNDKMQPPNFSLAKFSVTVAYQLCDCLTGFFVQFQRSTIVPYSARAQNCIFYSAMPVPSVQQVCADSIYIILLWLKAMCSFLVPLLSGGDQLHGETFNRRQNETAQASTGCIGCQSNTSKTHFGCKWHDDIQPLSWPEEWNEPHLLVPPHCCGTQPPPQVYLLPVGWNSAENMDILGTNVSTENTTSNSSLPLITHHSYFLSKMPRPAQGMLSWCAHSQGVQLGSI